MTNVVYFVFLILCFVSSACAQIKIYEEGPINEAYLSKFGGNNLILDAIPREPPYPINERIPPQTDMQAEWVPGYWAWQDEINDFVWVSGVWRKPPPGHLWISGFWKKFEEGWVWIHGFWNRMSEANLHYIGIAPPDSIEEDVPPPPNEGYAWNPGYWHFAFNEHEYQWMPGSWEELDPNWILIPAHYIWRPGGYLLISPYWDWPLNERGKAYASVLIEKEYRYQATFEPAYIIEPQVLVRRLYVHYPDYLFVFHHHYHFHPEFWSDCGCAPPWWEWSTWWSYTWHDHWSLWWWYTHPGYPQPYWLTAELSSVIAPPNMGIISLFSRVTPPSVVTPYGVVTRRQLLQANSKISRSFAPILPYDRKVRDKVYSAARPDKRIKEILKPSGKQLPIDRTARRPNIRKPLIDSSARSVMRASEDKKLRIPTKPRLPSSQRSTILEARQKPGEREDKTIPQSIPSVRKHSWTPRSQESERKVIYQPPSENQGPSLWNPRSDGYDEPIRRPPIRKTVPRVKREYPQVSPLPKSQETIPTNSRNIRQEAVPQSIRPKMKEAVPQSIRPKMKEAVPQSVRPKMKEVVPPAVPLRISPKMKETSPKQSEKIVPESKKETREKHEPNKKIEDDLNNDK
jgi:hypothetical protein